MRLDPDVLDDQIQPSNAAPDSGLFTDIPRPIWIMFLSAWALVFGVILLVLAYKLRSRHIDRSPTAAARSA